MSWTKTPTVALTVSAAPDDKKGRMAMSPETAKQITDLNKRINEDNIMIAYYQDRLKHYKEEKQKLQTELDNLRDDFWEDDV